MGLCGEIERDRLQLANEDNHGKLNMDAAAPPSVTNEACARAKGVQAFRTWEVYDEGACRPLDRRTLLDRDCFTCGCEHTRFCVQAGHGWLASWLTCFLLGRFTHAWEYRMWLRAFSFVVRPAKVCRSADWDDCWSCPASQSVHALCIVRV